MGTHGFDANWVAGGTDALRLLVDKDKQYDLLLSALNVPDVRGLDLMVVARSKGIPGIAVTAYGLDSDRKASADAGFSAHLTKPVDLEELMNAMEKVIQARRADKGT